MTTITLAQAIANLSPISAFNMLDPNVYSTLVWNTPDIPQPTEAEATAQQAAMQSQQPLDICKAQASKLLYATDWTTIPDITSPTNNPYLLNQADFIAYRNILRGLAVNPVVDPVFPPVPNAQWSS